MKRSFVFGGFCFFGLALQIALAAEGVVIQLPEKATVVGPEISLGEIAKIIADDKGMGDRLRRLTLGRAAPIGSTAKLTLGYLKVALRREGYTLKEFSFGGAETVEVLTQSQSFDPAGLLPQVKDFILSETGETPGNVDVKLDGAEKKNTFTGWRSDGEIQAILYGSICGIGFPDG